MTNNNFPSVAIIILNWNNWEDTMECLESIYQIDYPNFRLILTDNGSIDGSVVKFRSFAFGDYKSYSSFFKKNFVSRKRRIFEITGGEIISGDASKKYKAEDFSEEDLILLLNKKNLGFAEGNNIPIMFSQEVLKTEYVLLLNNDTVVSPDFLSNLISVAMKRKNFGAIGSKILYYDNPDKVQSVGGGFNMWTGRRIHYSIKKNLSKGLLKVQYISGACILVSSNVIEKIGYLDKEYFLYVEDIDWCYRIYKSGFNLYVDLSSSIWHKVSASTARGEYNSRVVSYIVRNDILFMKKHAKWYHYPTFIFTTIIVLIKSPVFRSRSKFRAALMSGMNLLLKSR